MSVYTPASTRCYPEALPAAAEQDPLRPTGLPEPNSLGFALFILLNAMLFIRPAELATFLREVPFYYLVILLCLAVSFPVILEQLFPESLYQRPLTLLVLGLLGSVFLSLLWQLMVENVAEGGVEFLKVVIYYLLFVGLVTTPGRIRSFLWWLSIFVFVIVLLTVLNYNEIIQLPTVKQTIDKDRDVASGAIVAVRRLQGTGIFSDPNDLGVLVVVAIFLCLYWMTDRASGMLGLLWIFPLGLFGYALTLTSSRGGLLALMAGLFMFFRARFGLSRALALGIILVPAPLLFLAGRQVAISTSEGTAQDRIRLWADAFMEWRLSPLFGIGMDQFRVKSGMVAHNSYLHAFTELGLLGGILFFGAFFTAWSMLMDLCADRHEVEDPQLHRLQPFLAGMLTSYMMGMFTLSLCYVVPTYAFLGLVTCYLRIATSKPPLEKLIFDGRLLARLVIVSLGFLVLMYVFVRLFNGEARERMTTQGLFQKPGEPGASATGDKASATGDKASATGVSFPPVADVPGSPPVTEDGPAITVLQPPVGWQLINLAELWRFRELIFILGWRDVKVRYKQTVLGATWAVLQPAMMMVVFTLFFGKLGGMEGVKGVPYHVFVYAGLLPWLFFSTAVTGASQSVIGSERLVTKVYFPRLVLPLASVGVAVVDFCFAFGLLVLLMLGNGIVPGPGLLLVPVLFVLLVIAALGVGIGLAGLHVSYRDFRYVTPFLIQLWMFATPSIYRGDWSNLDPSIQWLMALNPLTGLIAAFRAACLGETIPWDALAVSTAVICSVFVLGCLYFRRVEDWFADII